MAVNFNHINNTITAVGGTGLLQNIGAGAGGATYQLFTSSSTWTKPANAVGVYVECVGGGGGGGGGAYLDLTTHPNLFATGGAGGQAGLFISRFFVAASLASTVTVTVGAGGSGTGGASNPYVTSNGYPGLDGGASSFGSYITTPQAKGGAGGVYGSAPMTGINESYYGNGFPMVRGLYAGRGGAGNINAYSSTSVYNGEMTALGPGGGGPGGGVNTIGPNGTFYLGFDGGLGFAEKLNNLYVSSNASSQSFGGGGVGGNISSLSGDPGNPGYDGSGGGGGNGGVSGTGGLSNNGAGGDGGFPGGGGGGSGACNVLGAGSYPGGTGGNGYVLVVTW